MRKVLSVVLLIGGMLGLSVNKAAAATQPLMGYTSNYAWTYDPDCSWRVTGARHQFSAFGMTGYTQWAYYYNYGYVQDASAPTLTAHYHYWSS